MKYNVFVWYATCIEVDAEDEDSAIEEAKFTLDNTDDGTFRSIIGISGVEAEGVEE